MKKYGKEIAILVLFALACVVLVVFEYCISFTDDQSLDAMIRGTVSRMIAFALLLPAVWLSGCRSALSPKTSWRALLWCLPCLLVAICNFPIHEMLTGAARVKEGAPVWLFALECLSIGLLEELLFRGLLQNLLFDLMKKQGEIAAILVNSAAFGLWHLVNLLGGAGVGATLMQVGYSFLFGAMLSCVLLRTGNIWTCVVLHTIFDFGGLLIVKLGEGVTQDWVFWLLTAVAGVLCAAHAVIYVARREKQRRNKEAANPSPEGEGQ